MADTPIYTFENGLMQKVNDISLGDNKELIIERKSQDVNTLLAVRDGATLNKIGFDNVNKKLVVSVENSSYMPLMDEIIVDGGVLE